MISTFLHDSGSQPSVLGEFLGFTSFKSMNLKFSEKYGCKFQDGVFVTVTPCNVTLLQWFKNKPLGLQAIRFFLTSTHHSPFWALPSIIPSPMILTLEILIPVIILAKVSSG